MLDVLRQPESLSLDKIRTDGGTQPRAGLNEDVAQEYADAINGPNAWPFPPVVVFFDGDNYWLADGFHRIEAARRYCHREKLAPISIPCDIRQGTRRDAILYSVGANAEHGLRRTNADKRRAVLRLLQDAEWSQWSNREIARRCKVDEKTVRNLRNELTADNPQLDTASRTYTTRHGTVATMNTANIGAQAQAEESEKRPDLPERLPVHIRPSALRQAAESTIAPAQPSRPQPETPENLERAVLSWLNGTVSFTHPLERLEAARTDTEHRRSLLSHLRRRETHYRGDDLDTAISAVKERIINQLKTNDQIRLNDLEQSTGPDLSRPPTNKDLKAPPITVPEDTRKLPTDWFDHYAADGWKLIRSWDKLQAVHFGRELATKPYPTGYELARAMAAREWSADYFWLDGQDAHDHQEDPRPEPAKPEPERRRDEHTADTADESPRIIRQWMRQAISHLIMILESTPDALGHGHQLRQILQQLQDIERSITVS